MQEAFKGVIWRRPPEGQGPYKYIVVGVLLTDRPLKGADVSEVILAGPCPGLAEALEPVDHAGSRHRIGDANDALESLDYVVEMPQEVGLTRIGNERWRDCLERQLEARGDEDMGDKLDQFDRVVALQHQTPCAIALNVWADSYGRC